MIPIYLFFARFSGALLLISIVPRHSPQMHLAAPMVCSHEYVFTEDAASTFGSNEAWGYHASLDIPPTLEWESHHGRVCSIFLPLRSFALATCRFFFAAFMQLWLVFLLAEAGTDSGDDTWSMGARQSVRKYYKL